MTTVLMNFKRPRADGVDYPARGYVQWTPTARRDMEGYILLPKPFKTNLVEGEAEVELLPTTSQWYWKAEEVFEGLREQVFYYVVPDSLTDIDYDDLIQINPETGGSGTVPSAAWAAALDTEIASRAAGDAGLQSQIDAIEAGDVESINGLDGAITITLVENPPSSGFFELEVDN